MKSYVVLLAILAGAVVQAEGEGSSHLRPPLTEDEIIEHGLHEYIREHNIPYKGLNISTIEFGSIAKPGNVTRRGRVVYGFGRCLLSNDSCEAVKADVREVKLVDLEYTYEVEENLNVTATDHSIVAPPPL